MNQRTAFSRGVFLSLTLLASYAAAADATGRRTWLGETAERTRGQFGRATSFGTSALLGTWEPWRRRCAR